MPNVYINCVRKEFAKILRLVLIKVSLNSIRLDERLQAVNSCTIAQKC